MEVGNAGRSGQYISRDAIVKSSVTVDRAVRYDIAGKTKPRGRVLSGEQTGSAGTGVPLTENLTRLLIWP